jgi:PAS domain S-box-containing protein
MSNHAPRAKTEAARARSTPGSLIRTLALLVPIQIGMGSVLFALADEASHLASALLQALTVCVFVLPLLWWMSARGAKASRLTRTPDMSRAHARLRLGYGAVIAVIAVIIVCRAWMVQQEIVQAKGRGAVIESANAQRVLGEQFALTLAQIATQPAGAAHGAQLVQAALQMQSALTAIERAAADLRDGGDSLHPLLGPASINVATLLAAARSMEAAATLDSGTTAEVARRWLDTVRAHQTAHASAMDRAVATLAATADARVLRVARIAVVVSALLLGALALAVYLVLEPAARALEQQTESIQEQQQHVDRLADIARRTSEAVVITDAERRIEWVNAAYTRITGYTLEEVRGELAGGFLHGERTDTAAAAAIRTALERGEAVAAEVVNYARDGREFIVRLDIKPLHDALGQLSGFMSIQADVTAERRMEQALRASEQRFRALVEDAEVIVWEFEPGLNAFTYVSPHATRMGYSIEEWLQPGFFEAHLHHEDRAAALEFSKSETMAGRNHRLQYRMLKPDGESVWMDDWVSVESLPDGSRRMRGVLTDITELKRVQKQLHETEERWNMALQGSGDGVWDWDVAAGRTYRSPSLKETLGYRGDEIGDEVGFWQTLLHPDDRAQARAQFEAHVEGRAPLYRSEHRMRCKDGSYKWVLARGKVLRRSAEGHPLRMVGTQTDISAQKALQEELHRHHNQLQLLVEERTADLTRAMQDAEAARVMAERANKSKSMFLANMSHELRTPMHAILSFARLGAARHAGLDVVRLGDYFRRIETSGERLLQMLNDLLDLSKLESGRARVQPEWISGSILVRSVADELEPLLHDGRHQLRIHGAADPGKIWLDGERMRQVLRNLIANAIRFSPDGGAIDVRIERAQVDGAGMLALSVSDEGVGIPPEELDSIFDEFVQSSKTVSGAGGTGLGLAICKRIVDAHGGTLDASNNVHGGASFVIRLPQPQLERQEAAQAA